MATRSPSRTRDARRTMTKSSRGTKTRASAKRRRRKSAKSQPAGTALPGWKELGQKGAGATRKTTRAPKPSLVDGVPTFRFAALILAACALFTLYVGHVYATQELVSEVQTLRKENGHLVLKRNRLAGEFDRMTSPSVILDRADALGLEPGSEYGPTIIPEPLD